MTVDTDPCKYRYRAQVQTSPLICQPLQCLTGSLRQRVSRDPYFHLSPSSPCSVGGFSPTGRATPRPFPKEGLTSEGRATEVCHLSTCFENPRENTSETGVLDQWRLRGCGTPLLKCTLNPTCKSNCAVPILVTRLPQTHRRPSRSSNDPL